MGRVVLDGTVHSDAFIDPPPNVRVNLVVRMVQVIQRLVHLERVRDRFEAARVDGFLRQHEHRAVHAQVKVLEGGVTPEERGDRLASLAPQPVLPQVDPFHLADGGRMEGRRT